jgi:ATP-dependent RNA helicase DDX5/DBP2
MGGLVDGGAQERDQVLKEFKSGAANILVATDVAARGLDVKDIQLVVNFDFPNNMEDYIHRIGRSGRAGAKGCAISFFTSKQGRMARELTKILQESGNKIPPELDGMSGGGFGSYGGRGRFGR